MRPLALAALIALGCSHAHAQAPALHSVDGLLELLAAKGHSVVEETADDGPNLVVDGNLWSISLAGCTARSGCSYGSIYARRRLDQPLTTECANEWNGREPFANIWIDGVGAPWLTATVVLAGNPERENVAASLDWFAATLAPFAAHIAECSTWGEEKP